MREFIAAGMAVAVLASAGEGLAQDAGATTVLEPIYVTTPLRRPSTIVQSTSTVTVVTEEDIERSAAVDLPSLLRSYPGVNVTTNGGMGANAGITLRGTNTGQTLVLVDGMRVASATGGSTAIANIPLASIARVEIVDCVLQDPGRE